MKPIPIIRHVSHEAAGTLEESLAEAGLEFRYLDLFDQPPSDARLDIEAAPGLVVMGGPMNVDETAKYPFLAAEVEWIRQAVRRRRPVLGICLGSQLLAKAMGAKVFANPVKEIGWYTIELTPAAADDPLLAGCGQSLTVFQWHGDTFDLPPGAISLAEGSACRNQAFRVGDCAYGLQFHLEVTPPMLDDWLREIGNCRELAELDYIDPQAIRAAAPRQMPPLVAVARRVFGRFAGMCRAAAGAGGESQLAR
jgi:GMP synthase (glutamine-hydrolysing)